MKGRRGEAAAKGGKSIAESFRPFRARFQTTSAHPIPELITRHTNPEPMTRVSLSVSPGRVSL